MANDLHYDDPSWEVLKKMIEHGYTPTWKDLEQMSIFSPKFLTPPPPPPPPSNILSGVAAGISAQPINVRREKPAWLDWDKWGGSDSPDSLLRMLAMRLRLHDGQQFPFDFIMPCRSGEKVVLFLIVKGEPTFMEDGMDLYPSDALITKLRLIAQ